VLRRAVILALLVLVPVGGAAGAPQELIPGLTYDRQVQFTTRGPVVVNILTVPRPGGLWQVRPVLSNEAIGGTERLTAIEKRYSADETVAGINGDRTTVSGAPSGMLMRGSALDQPPLPGRSSIGLDVNGTLTLGRVTMLATWQGRGPRRALNDVNGPPGANGVALYTPAYGPATPSTAGSFELVFSSFPAALPNTELVGSVSGVAANGATPIPPGGAVLVSRGTAAAFMQKEAGTGQAIKIRLILKPAWTSVVAAIGGGPVLVRNGRPIFRANEDFTADQLLPRTARSAIGQLADGRLLLVTVDGGQPGYSVGATNFELALLMVRLGAVTAAALDGGASAAMAFDGRLLSRPTGAERGIADAILVAYSGVYAPPPAETVLSPNGDGVADTQHLAYKLVRQSNVNAQLIGPDGVARAGFSGQLGPGVYPYDWNGAKGDGTPDVEGQYRWVVSATDDTGQASGAEQDFTLNRTLGFAKPVAPALAVPRPQPRAVASFTLTRPATLTTRIETTSGVVLRTLPKRSAGPGDVRVFWDGTTDGGATVYSGTYVAELTATNELGPVTLAATFTVRRK
jgi:hypothetical protein